MKTWSALYLKKDEDEEEEEKADVAPTVSSLPVKIEEKKEEIKEVINEPEEEGVNLNDFYVPNQSKTIIGQDIIDTSHPKYRTSIECASDLVNDFLEVLKRYIDFDMTDRIVTNMTNIQKMIASKYYFSRNKPLYERNQLLYLMGVNNVINKKKKKVDKDGLPLVKRLKTLKEDETVTDEDDKQVTDDEEEEDMDFDNPQATVKLIEMKTRKINLTKRTTKNNINAWIYSTLPLHKLLKVLGGNLVENHLNSFVTINLADDIFACWLDRNESKMEKATLAKIETYGLNSSTDVQKEVDSYNNSIHPSEVSVSNFIKRELNTPQEYLEILFSPIIVTKFIEAWHIIENMLKNLYNENPTVKGFYTYGKYRNKDTNVPDVRMILMPLPLGTKIHMQAEFCNLVSILISIQKETTGDKSNTRFQIENVNTRYAFVLSRILLQMKSMGFEGIKAKLSI